MRRVVYAFALPDDFADREKKDQLSELGEHRVYRLFVRLASFFPHTLGHVKIFTEGAHLPNLHAHSLIRLLEEHQKEIPRAAIRVDYEEMEDFTGVSDLQTLLREMKTESDIQVRVDTPIFYFSLGGSLSDAIEYCDSSALLMDFDGQMHFPINEHYLAGVVDYQKDCIEMIVDPLTPRKVLPETKAPTE